MKFGRRKNVTSGMMHWVIGIILVQKVNLYLEKNPPPKKQNAQNTHRISVNELLSTADTHIY
jgi:hypothetical protein